MNTKQSKNISNNNEIENTFKLLREEEKKIDFLCPTPHKLVIKGSYVKFSDFTKFDGQLENLCKNGAELNSINVFALKRVFIDADLKGIGDKLQVTIIAPEWEVVGTKRIVLDGSPAIAHFPLQAMNGTRPGSRGEDGKPGLPGGPAGSFFGIGTEFFNGANLTISANGGEGGEGQYGGHGSAGKNGESPELPTFGDSPDKYSRLTIESSDSSGSSFHNTFSGISYVTVIYLIHGTKGTYGGKGGDGGIGGLGGNPGNIRFISLGDNAELPHREMRKGNHGMGGYAGIGGVGGKNGYAIRAEYTKSVSVQSTARYYERKTWNILGRDIFDGSADSNKEGNYGANAKDSQYPISAPTIQHPAYIINNYKSYLRENLNDASSGHFKKYSLIEFLNQLDSNSNVKNNYDTLGLVNELQALEEQLRVLSKKDLIFSYQSLIDRINEYAKTPKSSESSNQYKKLLSYLYTAALSRLYNLKNDSGPNLIIDISNYLTLVEKNIKNLEALQENADKVDVINQSKQSYKAIFDKKIDEAKSFIETQISLEMDNISTQLDNDIDLLINETVALQEQAGGEKRELINKKRELENALVLRKIFSAFKFLGQVSGFLGPVGAVGGLVIEASGTITESLVLDDETNQQKPLKLPSSISSNLKLYESKIKTTKDVKIANFNKRLEKIAKEITAYTALDDLSKNVASMQRELEKINPDEIDFGVLKKIENSYDKLKEDMKIKENKLKTQKTMTDQSALKVIAALTRANHFVQLSTVGFDVYSKYKNDQAKLDVMHEAIQQKAEELQNLKRYEMNIYNTVAPMLKNTLNDLKDIESKLGTKSQIALDINKWRVQSTIKDIRLQMQQLTAGFKVKDSLVRHIEKLEEAMTTLINIYDRIQNYQDQQSLANYIAQVSSPAAYRIVISDTKLSNAIKDLEIIIRSNLVLEEYQRAMNALKQCVFPCADNYLRELAIPHHLELDNSSNISDLVSQAVKKIKKVKAKVDEYKATVRHSDTYRHRAEFNSDFVSTKSFFIWENERYKDIISKLLAGQEIVVKADIANSPFNKDAIKFNLIGINFKSANQTIQSELNSKLKGFKVSATHLGNSYYRYNDKIYVITSDSQTIEYSFEKNANAEPVDKNDIYTKLKAGNLMLSPYTMWKFKLTNATNTISFHDLERYKGEVKLELVGSGSYISGNACSRVEDYYKADDTYHSITRLRNLNVETTDIINSTVRPSEKTRKKRHIKPAELNTHKKTQKGLQPLTILPYHRNSLNNIVTPQWLSSSQMGATAQSITSYCQIGTAESFVVFKWLCSLLGKHSIVKNLNKAERVSQGETATATPLVDEIENKLKLSIAIYGNKFENESFVSQKLPNFSAKNRVSAKNPLLFFETPLTQSSTDKIDSGANKTFLLGS